MPPFLGNFQCCDPALPAALALPRLLCCARFPGGWSTSQVSHALINVFSPFCCFISFKLVAQATASFKSEGVAALVQISAAVF